MTRHPLLVLSWALALVLLPLTGCSPAPAGPRKSTNVVIAPAQVWLEEGSYTYHRKSCNLMKRPITSVREDIMRERIGKAKPYKPCPICRP